MYAAPTLKKSKDERVLHIVNRFISLKDEDTKRNNEILEWVLDDIIQALKRKHIFFRECFQRIDFVGSHYKGTKVGKPEEFDLNLIIRLPFNYQWIEFERELPGFRKLKLFPAGYLPKWQEHSKLLSKWVSPDGYLNQNKFRQWVESLFDDMPKQTRNGKYQLRVGKSGPAFTLYVTGAGLFARTMCVDLVPVLEFKTKITDVEVETGYPDRGWYAVPKPFKLEHQAPPYHWRVSFYVHEKNFLTRHGSYKEIIKFVKKLRDREDWKLIASYHIETIFMKEILDDAEEDVLDYFSKIDLFLYMLRALKEACEKVEILNFWDAEHNLIGDLKKVQLANVVGRLDKIIKHIKADRLKIAEYLLTPLELREVQKELNEIRNGRNSVDPNIMPIGSSVEPPERQATQQEAPQGSFLWNVFRAIFGIVR